MNNNNQFIFATDDKDLYDAYYEKKIPFSPELSKFPTLSSINSKADFDSEVHLWKNQINEKIKNAMMPLPLSLSVYAPEVANLPNSSLGNNPKVNTINSDPNFLKASADSKYFDYRRNPPLPITFPEIFDKFILENPSSDGKSSFSDSVVHVKNQKPVPINIYAQDEQKWGSTLIPQEPSPDLFDSYESYKKSLKNWASLQNHKLSLIHPSDFISSIGIIHSENDGYKNNDKLYLSHEKETENQPKIFETNFASNIQKVFNPDEFLSIKAKKAPPAPLLIQLFSLTYRSTKTNNSFSSIKYSESSYPKSVDLKNTLPFKVPYTKNALISKVDEVVNSNSDSSRVIRLLKSYKNISDPFIDKTVISDANSAKMTLFTDFSANQTDAALRQLTPQQTDELTNSFPFYLHQLHIVRSNRIRCRFFIIISNILEKKPKLISTFLADVQTLSNVASVIADFSFLERRIYTYESNSNDESDDKPQSESPTKSTTNSSSKSATNSPKLSITPAIKTNSDISSNTPPKSVTDTKSILIKRKAIGHVNSEASPVIDENPMRRKSSFSVRKPIVAVPTTAPKLSDIKKTVEDLTFFLFVSQLLKVLTAFVEKYQPKNRNLLLQINAQTMTFSRFIDMSLTEKLNEIEVAFRNPTPQICVIFHFLCDYDPVSLSKLFQTNLFYIFLGKVALSRSCSRFFGEMCGHVLRLPKLRRIFFLQFFHLHCFMSSKTVMTTIAPTCNFLASLIKLESDCEHDITIDEIFTSFTNVTQLVLFSPSSSLNLIGAIIKLFLKMKPKFITSTNLASASSASSGSTLSASNSASNSTNAPNSGSANLNASTSSLSSSIGGVANNASPLILASSNVGVTSPMGNVIVNPAVSLNQSGFSAYFEASNKTFAHIRESILTLFRDPNLKSGHIVTLYNLMNLMLAPYRNDTKSFIERYLSTIVLNNMKSADEAVCVASWDVFREIFFDSNFQFLRDSQPLKASLSLIVASKRNLTPPVLIEILFLALGVSAKSFSFSSSVSAKESLKKKKTRRSINIFDQPEGFVIPGINPREVYVEVLKHAREGKLKDFKNEVETLKILMPNFKWKKRTISYA